MTQTAAENDSPSLWRKKLYRNIFCQDQDICMYRSHSEDITIPQMFHLSHSVLLPSDLISCSTSLICLNKLSSLYKSWKRVCFPPIEVDLLWWKTNLVYFLQRLENLSVKIPLASCSYFCEGQTSPLTLSCICFPYVAVLHNSFLQSSC